MTHPCTVDLYISPIKPQSIPLLRFFPGPYMGSTIYTFLVSKLYVNFERKISQSIWSTELVYTRKSKQEQQADSNGNEAESNLEFEKS